MNEVANSWNLTNEDISQEIKEWKLKSNTTTVDNHFILYCTDTSEFRWDYKTKNKDAESFYNYLKTKQYALGEFKPVLKNNQNFRDDEHSGQFICFKSQGIILDLAILKDIADFKYLRIQYRFLRKHTASKIESAYANKNRNLLESLVNLVKNF